MPAAVRGTGMVVRMTGENKDWSLRGGTERERDADIINTKVDSFSSFSFSFFLSSDDLRGS